MSIEYDKLKQELEDTKHVNSLPERERIIAKISGTALVDIAETLSQLLQLGAVESATVTLENTFEPATNVERPLEVGDTVRVKMAGDSGAHFEITDIGESEGAAVAWLNDEAALPVMRTWLDELERVEPFAFVDPAPATDEDIEDDIETYDAYASLAARKRAARS
jgi:hypothetical protein